jgi:hypothetical protein
VDVRERTVCFGDYVVRCTDLQDRELFSVDIGMKEDLVRTKVKLILDINGLGEGESVLD